MAIFRKEFKKAGEKVPSVGKIHGFLGRRGISLQKVRDSKKKSVTERIDLVRDQLCRYDEYQRSAPFQERPVDTVWGRVHPDNHWAMDEYCIAMSKDTRSSYSDKGGDENHVKGLSTSREMSGIALFNLGETQPTYTYAIIPLTCKYSKAVDGSMIFDVRKPRSSVIAREAEQYPANVRCYYWPSGMCREPVFEAFAEDFLSDCNLDKDVKDRLLSVD